jgi:hypothetical protein
VGLVVLGLAALAAVVMAVAVSGGRRGRPGTGELPPRAGNAARTVGAWRGAGTTVGIAVAAWSLQADSLGRGLMLAAPLLALCVLAGVVVGELLVSAPAGPVRQAGLAVRRWQAYLPARLTVAVVGSAGLLAGILVATTLAGSPDDMGRAGRWLARQCSAVMTQAHGPWPGSFYAVPLAAVVGGGLLLAGLAVLRIARRPSQGEDPAIEDALRRRSAAAVTAAAGLLVAVPLAGVSAIAGMGLLGIECRPALWTVLGWGLVAVLPVAVALGARCLVVLLVPTLAEPRRTPTPVGR